MKTQILSAYVVESQSDRTKFYDVVAQTKLGSFWAQTASQGTRFDATDKAAAGQEALKIVGQSIDTFDAISYQG